MLQYPKTYLYKCVFKILRHAIKKITIEQQIRQHERIAVSYSAFIFYAINVMIQHIFLH